MEIQKTVHIATLSHNRLVEEDDDLRRVLLRAIMLEHSIKSLRSIQRQSSSDGIRSQIGLTLHQLERNPGKIREPRLLIPSSLYSSNCTNDYSTRNNNILTLNGVEYVDEYYSDGDEMEDDDRVEESDDFETGLILTPETPAASDDAVADDSNSSSEEDDDLDNLMAAEQLVELKRYNSAQQLSSLPQTSYKGGFETLDLLSAGANTSIGLHESMRALLQNTA